VQFTFFATAVILLGFTKMWYFGLFFLAFSIFSFVVTKDYIACKVYKGQLAVFNPKQQQEILVIPFTEIVSFQQDNKAFSFVLLNLKGKGDEVQSLVIPTFQAKKLRRKLLSQMAEKDIDYQKAQELQKNRLSNKEVKANKQKLKEKKQEK
jgi:hypothetical protein